MSSPTLEPLTDTTRQKSKILLDVTLWLLCAFFCRVFNVQYCCSSLSSSFERHIKSLFHFWRKVSQQSFFALRVSIPQCTFCWNRISSMRIIRIYPFTLTRKHHRVSVPWLWSWRTFPVSQWRRLDSDWSNHNTGPHNLLSLFKCWYRLCIILWFSVWDSPDISTQTSINQ